MKMLYGITALVSFLFFNSNSLAQGLYVIEHGYHVGKIAGTKYVDNKSVVRHLYGAPVTNEYTNTSLVYVQKEPPAQSGTHDNPSVFYFDHSDRGLASKISRNVSGEPVIVEYKKFAVWPYYNLGYAKSPNAVQDVYRTKSETET